ncbi:endonuclease/exonuclease/phosphatase family protein [Spirochaetota bacterium]
MKKIIFVLLALSIFTQCNGGNGDCRFAPKISTKDALNNFNLNTTAITGSDLVIMSRNLYLGADITPLLTSTSETIFENTGIFFDEVVNSQFQRRAQGIVREIMQIQPDIIGLQEVMTYRTDDPPNLLQDTSVLDADCIEYDFLDIILDALEDNNLNYKVAVVSPNTDIELTDFVEKDVRITVSNVILAREDMTITDVNTTIFTASLPVELPGIAVNVYRSYSSILVNNYNSTGVDLRVINTHLEPEPYYMVQGPQGDELILAANSFKSFDDPIIMVGDFNSGPDTTDNTTYQNLLTNFTDSWDDNNSGIDGFTCCIGLESDDPDLIYERIDHIFYWNPSTGSSLVTVGSIITQTDVGEQVIKDDENDTTIWSSDHAGRVTGFNINQ